MNNYKFNLSGFGDAILENNIRESVEKAGYSVQELSDIREPVKYDLFDSLVNQDILKQTLADLQKTALLKHGVVVSNSFAKLKNIIKKIYAKLFRRYIDSVVEYQFRFNHEVLIIISELFFYFRKQDNLIKQLQNELNELKKNNV